MNANTIVTRLIESTGDPNGFENGNEQVYVRVGEPTDRFHFNIGEGNYRCGIAFDILAVFEEGSCRA